MCLGGRFFAVGSGSRPVYINHAHQIKVRRVLAVSMHDSGHCTSVLLTKHETGAGDDGV